MIDAIAWCSVVGLKTIIFIVSLPRLSLGLDSLRHQLPQLNLPTHPPTHISSTCYQFKHNYNRINNKQ